MFHDCRGREILIGNTVVYPGRRGSGLWLNEGTVVDILPALSQIAVQRVERSVGETKLGRTVYVSDLSRVAVVA